MSMNRKFYIGRFSYEKGFFSKRIEYFNIFIYEEKGKLYEFFSGKLISTNTGRISGTNISVGGYYDRFSLSNPSSFLESAKKATEEHKRQALVVIAEEKEKYRLEQEKIEMERRKNVSDEEYLNNLLNKRND